MCVCVCVCVCVRTTIKKWIPFFHFILNEPSYVIINICVSLNVELECWGKRARQMVIVEIKPI